MGNPTTYRGKILQWSHGRQLDAFGDIATYTYNANDIRTNKTVTANHSFFRIITTLNSLSTWSQNRSVKH